MMTNQRTFRRFDIMAVLEFKLLTAMAGVFVGITRNFSYEGLCMETQCLALEPGDKIEILLKHPHNDLTAFVQGTVVWKRDADKFAYEMGIKLLQTELDTRMSMLEIMSATGDVPIDSFLSEGGDEEDIDREAFGDEGLLSAEEDRITAKTADVPFQEILNAATHAEGQEMDDVLKERAMISDIPRPADAGEGETGQTHDDGDHPVNKLLGNRKLIYSSIAAVVLAVSVYALSIIFKSPDIGIESPVPAPVQSIFREESPSRPVPAVEDSGTDEVAVRGSQQQAEQQIPEEPGREGLGREMPPVPRQLPAEAAATDIQTHYVQVGAWRNPDNAREMLDKLKRHYPDAFISVEKSLNKIKIPVKGEPQGREMLIDIEDKFHLKPLLIKK